MRSVPPAPTSVEQLYRLISEGMSDYAVVLLDPDGYVVSWTLAAERIEGYSAREILGEHISLLSWVDSPEAAHSELDEAALRGRVEREGWRRRKDGSRYWANVVVSAARNEAGEVTGFVRVTRDLTGRHAAEQAFQDSQEALAASEKYFRRLIEHASEAITIVNDDGSVRYSTPAIQRLLGYSPEERRGRPVFELIHPDDRAEAARIFTRLRADPGATRTFQMRAIGKDGQTRIMHVTAQNLLDDPIIKGIVLNTRDVSEQKHAEDERRRAEHELRESEQRFRTLIENSSDIVAVIDAHGRLAYTSPAMARVLGFEPEDISGMNGFELLHADDHKLAREVMTRALENPDRTFSAELRVRHHAGTWRTLDVRIRNMLSYPSIAGIVINAHDITERTAFEEALLASERRYRTIIETAGEGVIIRDVEDRITFANQRMADLLGYKVDELIGRHISEIVCEEDRAAFDELLNRTTGSDKGQFDLRARRKDGSEIWGIVSARPMYDTQGNPVGALTMFMDISGRKQLEEQLRQAQKMEAIGRLAGGIAHDFNNLLTAIRGNAEMMLADMTLDHPLRPDLDEINRAAERASALTRQLLAFSRRQILQPRVLDLDVVVGEMERLIRRLIGEHIELVTAFTGGGATVRADRGQVEQVLMNLVVNARDAMPAGGQLTIETRFAELDEEFVRTHPGSSPGSFVCLSVADTGVGMDARTLSHVFEPFFTTKPVGKGTGLGLATVYGIVKQSGGYIAVQSEVGAGALFEIFLPHVLEPPEPGREPVPAATGVGAGQTVLLVEDEDSVRLLASRVLRKNGYRVLEASDGLEAVRVAENYGGFIHVLLTDVVMPRMGGRELVERLRPARPGMRIIYMSGYTDDALLQHGVSTGASAWFMEKPFTPGTLINKLRQVIELD